MVSLMSSWLRFRIECAIPLTLSQEFHFRDPNFFSLTCVNITILSFWGILPASDSGVFHQTGYCVQMWLMTLNSFLLYWWSVRLKICPSTPHRRNKPSQLLGRQSCSVWTWLQSACYMFAGYCTSEEWWSKRKQSLFHLCTCFSMTWTSDKIPQRHDTSIHENSGKSPSF